MMRSIVAILAVTSAYTASASVLEDAVDAMRRDCPATQATWLMRAEQGDAIAQFQVGVSYDFGGDFGCSSSDSFKAFSWYEKSAVQGYLPAQSALAFAYYDGRGTAPNFDAALSFARRAAERGEASAQLLVGLMYKNGDGTPQDYVEAVRWFRASAMQGDVQGQVELSQMYEKGLGVGHDRVQAYMWLNIAAGRSSPVLKQRREFIVKLRDELMAKMTSQQVTEGQRLSREWAAK